MNKFLILCFFLLNIFNTQNIYATSSSITKNTSKSSIEINDFYTDQDLESFLSYEVVDYKEYYVVKLIFNKKNISSNKWLSISEKLLNSLVLTKTMDLHNLFWLYHYNIDKDNKWNYVFDLVRKELIKRDSKEIKKEKYESLHDINFSFEEIRQILYILWKKKNKEEFLSYISKYEDKEWRVFLGQRFIKKESMKTIYLNSDVTEELERNLYIVSFRERDLFKYDPLYRQTNISYTYNWLRNNMIILKSGQTFSFNKLYGEIDKITPYKDWIWILKGKEELMSWWGVCGAATWIYQSVFLIEGLKVTSRPHGTWYNHLYTSKINGENIRIPWLDATYYGPYVDLKLENTNNYPVFSLNRIVNKKEENIWFIYSKKKEKKELKYIRKVGKCHEWKIWEEKKLSCYKEEKK